jgi:mannose-6-phosphate isomerase-like protein (cupin superfamily)
MKIRVRDHVALNPEKMARVALATTTRAQLDLYCLAPGQEQKAHTHADQDKIYFVLEGRGRIVLDNCEETIEAGEAVVAPAGAAHGLANAGATPLLALVVVTPPPRHA